MDEYDYKKAYKNGLYFFNNCDYINAKYWFELSKEHLFYKEESIIKLINIEIREGRYANARKMLNLYKDFNNTCMKQTWWLLENIENNFGTSLKYYSECMKDPNMQYKSLLAISKLYIQTGDNEIARKMLETLQLNYKFRVKSIFGLVELNILEEDYKEAMRLLNLIDKKALTPKLLQHYTIIYTYLLSKLGRLKDIPCNLDPIKDYMVYRLYDNSEETLLRHISKHLNQKEKNSNGAFLKNIDLKELLHDARNKIENMNPNHFEVSDMYRFRLEKPIGIKGDEITNDLCVVTMISSKEIITMYPIQLSKEFDKEGFTYNKIISLKRNQGGIKNDK